MQGRIVHFDRIRQFGFIESSDRPQDTYFQGKNVAESDRPLLAVGRKVQFDLGRNTRGFVAANITVLPEVAVKENDGAL
jgi:cold shock CspA family protein